jgi:hypothetical protein
VLEQHRVKQAADVEAARCPQVVRARPGDGGQLIVRPEVVPPGLGLGTIDQAVPFQCSIRVCSMVEPDSSQEPTAQALDADRSSTPLKLAVPVPAGTGTATLDQAVPFHCSASGLLAATSLVPTAHALVVLAADTAAKE